MYTQCSINMHKKGYFLLINNDCLVLPMNMTCKPFFSKIKATTSLPTKCAMRGWGEGKAN